MRRNKGMRSAPPEKPYKNRRLAKFLDVDKEYYLAAMERTKKEISENNRQ